MKDTDKIHRLIEKYFDGETSLEEERILRQILPRLSPGDEIVDSALAVMALANVSSDGPHAISLHPQDLARKKWTRLQRWSAGIAASIIIAIALFATFSSDFTGNMGADSSVQNQYAYVNGKKIEDSEIIKALIEEEFSQMAEAGKELSDDVSEELGLFKDYL